MGNFEETHIYPEINNDCIFYARYIDDILTKPRDRVAARTRIHSPADESDKRIVIRIHGSFNRKTCNMPTISYIQKKNLQYANYMLHNYCPFLWGNGSDCAAAKPKGDYISCPSGAPHRNSCTGLPAGNNSTNGPTPDERKTQLLPLKMKMGC